MSDEGPLFVTKRQTRLWGGIGAALLLITVVTSAVVRYKTRPAPPQLKPTATATTSIPAQPAPPQPTEEELKKQQIVQQVSQHLEEARVLMEAKDYASALRDHLQLALELDPENTQALDMKRQADDAIAAAEKEKQLRAQNRAKAAPPTEPEIPGIPRRPNESPADYASRARRVQTAFNEGKARFDKNEYAPAINQFRAVERDQPHYQNVDSLIAETLAKQQRAVEEAVTSGQQNEQAGNLRDARLWYLRALEIDPSSTAAREKHASLLRRTNVQAVQLLTIAPVPTGGTVEGLDIICGTKGSVCSANHPEGVPVELHPTADAGFTFMGFSGDCAPMGHTQMTAPRICSATFSPTAEVAAARTRTVPRLALPPPGVVNPTPAPPPPGVVNPPSASPRRGQVPVPPTPEEYAKGQIQVLLESYCAAYQAIDPAAVQRVYPKVDMDALKIELNARKYKSVQCTFGDLEFVSLDSGVGQAVIQTDFTRVFQQTLSSKVETAHVIATMTLFRPSPRSPWLIDRMTFRPSSTATPPATQPSGVAQPSNIFQAVTDYVARMRKASAGFSVEKEMIVGQPYTVRLKLSPTASVEKLRNELGGELGRAVGANQPAGVSPRQSRIETKAEPVSYGPHMIGRITAVGCAIEALRPEDQVIPEDRDAEWAWQLVPQKAQHLKVTVRLEAVVEGTSAVIQVFEGDVDVQATMGQRVTAFVGGNWQWLWTTVATPVVAYWYAVVRKRRKKRSRKKKS